MKMLLAVSENGINRVAIALNQIVTVNQIDHATTEVVTTAMTFKIQGSWSRILEQIRREISRSNYEA